MVAVLVGALIALPRESQCATATTTTTMMAPSNNNNLTNVDTSVPAAGRETDEGLIPSSPIGVTNGNAISNSSTEYYDSTRDVVTVTPEKENEVNKLQQELQEAQWTSQQAVEALHQLQEAVRIVTRQLKEQPPVVVTDVVGEDDDDDDDEVPSTPCNLKLTATTSRSNSELPPVIMTLPLSSITAPTQHNVPPISYVQSNRHRSWSAGTATSNLSSAANTVAGTTASSVSPSVVSFCTDDELRLAQLLSSSPTSSSSSLSSLPADVAADVMNLVNAAYMIRDHAKWATLDVASLVEEMQQLQYNCQDAVRRAHDAEQQCNWYQTHIPPLYQQLVQTKAEKKALKKTVKQLQDQLQQQEDEIRMFALEHHVLNALQVHEEHLSKHTRSSASDTVATNEVINSASVEKDGDDDDVTTFTPSVPLKQPLEGNITQETTDKKEDEIVIVHLEQHDELLSNTLDAPKTTPNAAQNCTTDSHTKEKLQPAEAKSEPEKQAAFTTTTTTPRGLGFGATGALGFGAFNMHTKNWGSNTRPAVRTTTVNPPLSADHCVKPSETSTVTTPTAESSTAVDRSPNPPIVATPIAESSKVVNDTKSPSTAYAPTADVPSGTTSSNKNVHGSTGTSEVAVKDAVTKSLPLLPAYEPIKLQDRRSTPSLAQPREIVVAAQQKGADDDLGTKMFKFFQSRANNIEMNKTYPAPPRLQLVDDHNDDDDDNREDPTVRTCSTLSMNASWSPPQCNDHFVHCVCTDNKKLFVPEVGTPKTPLTDLNHMPLTHVTCSSYDLAMPTSALASPGTLSEGSMMSRNPCSSIRCDQNVLRSLAIPATERSSLVMLRSRSFPSKSLPTRRGKLEDQKGDYGRLHEC